MAGLSYR